VPVKYYPALVLKWVRAAEATDADLLLVSLDDLGVTAIEELPDGFRAFFASEVDRDNAAAVLGATVNVRVEAVDVSDEDWAVRSQAAIASISAGALTIAPPWDVPAGIAAERLIIIQPSMGFGTGHHASTRLCLQQLQQIPLTGLRVMDVGTGSGVLAIAAAKLGATVVVGIEPDPDALANARENTELNGYRDSGVLLLRESMLTDAKLIDRQFDVILANLTGAHLIREAAHFGPLAAPNARLIVSGFQTEESDGVIRALETEGWNLSTTATESTWVAAALTRR